MKSLKQKTKTDMEQPDILNRIKSQSGMTVPDGYFEDFAIRMEQMLPEQEFERQPNVLPRSWWQKVRPYAYLAAMFMGVWCMMKVFNIIQSSSSSLPDTQSNMIAKAVSNDKYFSEFYESEIDEADILDDLYAQGIDPSTISQNLTAQ
ncbi:MAG: hypothetical protein K2O88_04080 [Paramuribaculum sp.]|nr:hypothetical protein [Paramuribaculum sp.]